MFALKEKEYTISTFKRALQDEDKTYIGTFYESPLVADEMISAPTLTFRQEDDIVYLDVTLKPNAGEEVEQVEFLDMYMHNTNSGYVATKLDEEERKTYAEDLSKRFLTQNTFLSEIKDYVVTVIMREPTVTRMDTVINGVKYWQYTLTETTKLDEDTDYTHKVHCLLKEKTSDGENFFSGLVGKELGKRDTVKILDSIANENITGLLIGSYEVMPENNARGLQVATVYYATSDYILLNRHENEKLDEKVTIYHLGNNQGGTLIPDEAIEKSEVERIGDGRYSITVYTSHTTIKLLMG